MSKLGDDLDRLYKLLRRAAAVGAALAILCHFLPPKYRAPCRTMAHLCKAGD